MSLLRRSPYVTIEYLEAAQVVRFVRTTLSFGDTRTAHAELNTWIPALAGIDPVKVGVLLDFRLTPMTSDPDILRAVVTAVEAVGSHFTRRAVLLARPLLAPQSERVYRAGASIEPFFDEAEAMAHVGRSED